MTRQQVLEKARAARQAKMKGAPPVADEPEVAAPKVARGPVHAPVRRARMGHNGGPPIEGAAPKIERAPANMEYEIGENGRIVVRMGGEVFTRKRTGHHDPFQFAPGEIPDKMSYQWIAVSVHNNNDLVPLHTTQWFENGWRPVPASRHPGRFMAADKTGAIVRDGLMLVERPEILTREAREEDVSIARRQITDRNAEFSPPLPGARAHRGTQLMAKRSIEPMPGDVGRPRYEMAE
jgi:hypothetical protein